MHTVQSNVSTHIARLERELGVTLVDRTTGSPRPRARWRATGPPHPGASDALVADVAAVRATRWPATSGWAASALSAGWLVPLVLERATREHLKIHVVVVDATTTSLVPQLLADNLDLAIVNLPVVDPELVNRTLFDERVGPARAPAGRLSSPPDRPRRPRAAAEPKGTSFRDELDNGGGRAGVLRPCREA